GGVEERLGRQRPALQVELLQLIPIALDHDVFVFAHPLDLADGSLQFKYSQVVQAAEGNHEVEGFVPPRIPILRAVPEKIRLEIRLLRSEAVLGNIETNQFETRLDQ